MITLIFDIFYFIFNTRAPRIKIDSHRVVISDSFKARLTALFVVSGKFVFDFERKIIIARSTYLWIIPISTEIQFSEVANLEFESDTSASLFLNLFRDVFGVSGFGAGEMSKENVSLILKLKNNDRHVICDFQNVEVDMHTNSFGDDITIAQVEFSTYWNVKGQSSGDLNRKIKKDPILFLQFLAESIGVPTYSKVNTDNLMIDCPVCKVKTSMYGKTCLYCAAPLNEAKAVTRLNDVN